MSIINDALKKTQNNMEQNNQEKDVSQIYEKYYKGNTNKIENPGQPNTSKENPKDKDKKKSSLPWPLQILLLAAILAGLYFVLQKNLPDVFQTAKSKINKSLFKNRPYRPKPVPKASPAPEAVYQSQQTKLVLEGIMKSGDKQVALINGNIYEAGEIVGGKTILNISLKQVDVQDGDKIINLRLGEKY